MHLLLLGVALLFAAVIFFSSNGSASAQEARHAKYVNWNGSAYEIEYEFSNNATAATITEIQAREYVIEFLLSDATEDGFLRIWLPMALVKEIFSFDDTSPTHQYISIFIDGEDLDPETVSADCEAIAMEIPLFEGSQTIELVGSIPLPGMNRTMEKNENIFITPAIEAEGKTFQLDMVTNATACDISLVKEEKRLHIDVETGESSAQGFAKITVPHALLGGNYTVFVDGLPYTDYNTTYDEEANRSMFSINYDGRASSIDIVGTTVAPEFGLAGLAAAMPVLLLAYLGLRSLLQYRQR